MSLLLACTRLSADPTSLPTIPQAGGGGHKAGKGGEGVLALAFRLFWTVVNTIVHLWEFVAMVGVVKDSPTSMKGGRGSESAPHGAAVSEEISLADVAVVRKATSSVGTRVNHKTSQKFD